jgi:MoCo/4Fe-4S cofactor protein with predicted Tat translocation signal
MSKEPRGDLGLGPSGSGLGSRGSQRGSDNEPPAPSPQTLFWRTLDERADDPSFREHLYNEFPSQIEAITDPVARRTFLKLMGASLALAGVAPSTQQPAE